MCICVPCIHVLEPLYTIAVESSKSEEAERKLAEAERAHLAKMSALHQKLQEETEKW